MIDSPAPPSKETTDKPSAESRYYLLAGAMLVMIITILAILWLRERKSRIAFQQANETLVKVNENLKSGLQGNIAAALQGGGVRLQLDAPKIVEFQDSDTIAFEVPASQALRLDRMLRPGSILVVVEDPPMPSPSQSEPEQGSAGEDDDEPNETLESSED